MTWEFFTDDFLPRRPFHSESVSPFQARYCGWGPRASIRRLVISIALL
jgi:hypothetical protein